VSGVPAYGIFFEGARRYRNARELPTRRKDPVIGRTGRITGRVAPGAVGEVTLQIRGGSEAFYAYASVSGAVIEKGVKVKVDDFQPPLTVFVSPVDPAPASQFVLPRSLIQDTVPNPPSHHSYT
jgi:hypothetical protein